MTSFLASLPQNAIPSFVDPSRPIDPQLVLDFDTRSPRAADEVRAIVEDVWTQNPVVLFAKVLFVILHGRFTVADSFARSSAHHVRARSKI